MSEIILSALACNLPVIDGMNWTMVVAAQTACATAVMLPKWNVFKLDVAYRALLGAAATVDTYITIDGELLVRNHKTVEVGTDDMTESPGCQSQLQLAVVFLPVDNYLDKSIQVIPGLFYLLLFTLRLVCVHKRQTDIAFRHDERLNALQVNTLQSQFLCQHLNCQARAVTTGAQCVCIMASNPCNGHPMDELADNMWRLPTMNRETKSDTLAFCQCVVTCRIQLIRDEQQFLTCCCSQLFSSPTCITRTSEIENHSAKVREFGL